ncbi:hypothetical protein [Streptomyces rimosus]|uniref:hypothetical protein n=1 Tax=Streptomyces rimosus TaxID=1927 RepID=UPI0004C194AE|nr:hypothetical protein [Streptomyces rimosus]
MKLPFTCRARAAVAAAVATGLLAVAASLTTFYDGVNAGATVGTPGCSVGVEWRGDPGVFGSCTGTDPDAGADQGDEIVTAYNDGFLDGQADVHEGGGRDAHEAGMGAGAKSGDAAVTAYNDGFLDGQADARVRR